MRYAIILSVVIAAAGTVMIPDAQAQTESTRGVDIARAVELEREAEVASGERRRWSRAASLLEEASRLRPESDPVALANLRMAGTIYGALGQFERAKRTLLGLADRAIEYGEVATAANVLMDAAHIAVRLNDEPAVRSCYERANRLAMSSHLSSEEQRLITARLESSRSVFASVGR